MPSIDFKPIDSLELDRKRLAKKSSLAPNTNQAKIEMEFSDEFLYSIPPSPKAYYDDFYDCMSEESDVSIECPKLDQAIPEVSSNNASDRTSTTTVSFSQRLPNAKAPAPVPFTGTSLLSQCKPIPVPLKGATLVKKRLRMKANQRVNKDQDTTSAKKEVYLTTFNMDNGDEDGSIKAARDAFWKAYAHTFYMKGDARTTAQSSVFETLKSVVQAVNKNSSDFVYSLLPSARVDEQISRYQHDLFKSQDGYNLMLSILEYYNRLDEHWIAPEDEHARKVLGLPFDFQQGKHFYIGLITNDFILWCVVGNKDASLKAFLKCYTGELASRLDKSPTSLWFEYKNTPLFSSDAGKKKMGQFENGDLIYVSLKALPNSPKIERVPLKSLHGNNKMKPQRSKKGKRKSNKVMLPKKSEEELKEEEEKQHHRNWRHAIDRVFVEAEPLFKKKRDELNALKLKRTAPKARKKTSSSTTSSVLNESNSFTQTECLDKAGKSHLFVRVGEVENLYKTTKPSKITTVTKTRGVDDRISIDLHGYTKDEALCKLDECLPQWIDMAMKSNYPFVVSVTIVCGKGSQVLSEVVETWIKKNKKVANAPKSIH